MSRDCEPQPVDHCDGVDEIVGQWGRVRPEVDVSGMEIIGRISRLQKQLQPLLDSVFADHDLESWEFDVLATLLRSGEPHQLTPGQLLESTMVTSGAMTNRLDRLERRGFVVRSKSPLDGRQVLVRLTPRGVNKVDAALVDHAANELAILDGIDVGDRQRLIQLLRSLHHVVGDRRPA